MATELMLLCRVSYRDQEVTAPRLRGLLALLAGEPRTGCSTAFLVDGLWRDGEPRNPVKALQTLVARARSLLGAGVIVGTATGYRLALGEEQVDSSAVLLHAAAGAERLRSEDPAAALAEAEAGLALWGADGVRCEGDAPGDPVSALRAERAPVYRSLIQIRALALARFARRAEAVEPLTHLVRELPRDEEVLLELVRCQAATVGPATALATYDGYRRRLREELGADPGPALQGVHQELLRGAAPAVRRGVSHDPNPLLGRAADTVAVAEMLRTSRVTSIVGPGGLGKTRLAHAVSREAEQRVVHLVGLAGITSDADVVGEVASALGVGESLRLHTLPSAVPADVLTGMVGALGPGPALLVLDNCEHVIRGVAQLVQALVSAVRDLRVLTTSRAPLGISAESVYPLPELDLPTTVELFRQRARAARPGAELPTGTMTELCRRLDGLPLAAELAAARVRVMTVGEISHRLADRFALLRGGARDAPPRHRTLHAVVDWSWNLLDPAGQAVLRTLSVFPNGFTADAARYLLDDDELFGGLFRDGEVLEVLTDLVDQSLVKVVDTAAGARFAMLETIREFCTAQRARSGEDDRVTRRYLAWACDFGMRHHDALFGPAPFEAWERIRAEQDNLIQALRLGLAQEDGAAVAATTAVLATLWTTEANYARLVPLAQDAGPLLSHFRPRPDYVEVTRTATATCAMSLFLGFAPGAARTLVALRRLPPASPNTLVGAASTVLCALPGLLGPDESVLNALCDRDESLLSGVANCVASLVWENSYDPGRALSAAQRMLDAFKELRIPWIQAMAPAQMARLCLQTEQGREALHHLRSALQVLREPGLQEGDPIGVRWGMALANLHTGELEEAEHWVAQATLHEPQEAPDVLSPGLGVRAEIALARGDTEDGLRLWRRAAEGVRSSTAGPVSDLELDLEPWALEVQAVAVTAHARYGCLDLVEDLTLTLQDRLPALMAPRAAAPWPDGGLVNPPLCGALLLALGMADLDHGLRTGDARRTRSGTRLIALAERFRYLRVFQPTMSSALSRQAAEQADRAAYTEAVSAYAALDRDALRAAALTALRERDRGLKPL
ncbi:LuxR family transcriptional regulator [Streptomyces eurocidicus]|uniref:LuxR family transcriptional regulator n=1 Tax=Streptomyces eurocidicus TaxID=66423 RepID=A0A2N8NUA4_STREU|nr:BTAD domain-containing putative transcriptional regulator [Streptomyces eurocidicus]MBB5120188.1 putative ATPase [Streptomyces eurocidicus]MBF6056126.1 AfsR/SARP family transcriptional regulator [Streptomyces eurocidicus]PNE32346.1 LuxR family transcriptional regulator [Streptomyces eurocidicus]